MPWQPAGGAPVPKVVIALHLVVSVRPGTTSVSLPSSVQTWLEARGHDAIDVRSVDTFAVSSYQICELVAGVAPMTTPLRMFGFGGAVAPAVFTTGTRICTAHWFW